MSKSKGNILNPEDIIEKYGIDQLRYYLIKEVSLGYDGNISLENLKNCINNDLANNYGNLCQRVFSYIQKNYNGNIPKPKKLIKIDMVLKENLKNYIKPLVDIIDNQDLNAYIKKVVEFSFEANKYFNDSKPWSLKDSDADRMDTILFTVTDHIKNISILLSPIIPIASNKVLDILNITIENRNIHNINNEDPFDHKKSIKKAEILFKKIEDDN